jgi:hypothetical protein
MALPFLALPFLAKAILGTAAGGAAIGGLRKLAGKEMETDTSNDDAFPRGDRSAFGEAMDWLNLVGQPVQNLFAGRFGSAARTAVDVVGRAVDAVLPGDVIPDVSKPSDLTSPTELVEDAIGAERGSTHWAPRLALDIAGDIFTNPTGLISFGGGAANKVAKTADQIDTIGKTWQKVATTSGGKLINSGMPGLVNARGDILSNAIESGLTRSARKKLAKEGVGASDFARKILAEAGDDATAVAAMIADGGKYASMFQQGGIRFAGQSLVREGGVKAGAQKTIDFLDDVVTKMGTVSPTAESAVRGMLDVAAPVGRGVASVAKKGADLGYKLSGKVAGVAEPILRAMKVAKATGNNHAQVAANNMVRLFDTMDPAIRSDMSKVMFNIADDADGAVRTLSSRTVPAKPFMTKDEQLALLRDRVDDAFDSGMEFGGKSKNEVMATLSDVVDQNMKLFDIDTKLGRMSAPSMYVHPERGMVHVADLAQEHAEVLRAMGDDVKSAVDKVVDLQSIRDTAVQSLKGLKSGKAYDDMAKRVQQVELDLSGALDDIAANNRIGQWIADQGFTLQQIDTSAMSPPLYFQRQFVRDGAEGAGGASYAKSRVLREQDEFVDYLNTGAKLKMDAAGNMLDRVAASGRGVSYASVARNIVGESVEGNALAEAVKHALDELAEVNKPLADALSRVTKPIPPRSGFFKGLAAFNSFWKPAVLFGIGIPRFMSIARNKIMGPIQEITDSGAQILWKQIPGDIAQTAKMMGGEYADAGKRLANSFRKVREGIADSAIDALDIPLPKDRVRRSLAILDQAKAASAGDFRRMRDEIVRIGGDDANVLADAFDNGILDGFISTEELVQGLTAGPRARAFKDLMDVPGKGFQHIEHRMRLTQFMALRANGVSAAEAARVVDSAYLDYAVAGVEDRTMRDIIPFAAFTSRSIPQQWAGLSRHGAYRTGVASVYTTNNSQTVVPPWIEDQAYVDLGAKDEAGNPMVVAGFGSPLEVLNLVPSDMNLYELGRHARRVVAGQSNPLLKEGFAAVTGRDPFFNTKVGSYDKTPHFLRWFGAPDSGEFGRYIQNMRRFGVTAPIESVLTQADIIGDERTGPGSKLIRLLSGARITSVNQDSAIAQQLQEQIETNPRVKSGEFIYANAADKATQDLVDSFKRAKARARKAKEAANKGQ